MLIFSRIRAAVRLPLVRSVAMHRPPPWAILTLGALLAAASSLAAAPGERDAEAELAAVRSRISALDARLNKSRMARDQLAAELRDLERRMGVVVSRLRDIDGELRTKHGQLDELRAQERRHRRALTAQRAVLARQIRASYLLGRQDYLKLLFNQQDPAALSRALTYHGYFSRARARRIADTRAELERIADVEHAIATRTRELEDLQHEQAQHRAELEDDRAARATLLAKLDGEISNTGKRLQRLRQDEEKLTQLVRELREALADIPKTLDQRAPFGVLKGRLPWPSAGTLRHRFGSLRGAGNLRWQGVWIAAKRGQDVRAIAHGRVAYADWLRGFGLLMIIDHGDGYMSLYGHNESLYKEVGDWVSAGEVIASVGATGGSAESGLYFEIRHNGQPQDPLAWCSASAGGPALVSRQ
jgi:septal ring factor EnvC (AmiA/AmiB activator)